MRQRYPDAQIIIAADNDIKPGEPNTGKSAAEKTAKAVSGWVALPQSEEKADWNDFHQQHGLEAAAAAFNDSMYQPEGEKVVVKLKSIDGGKKEQKSALQGDELKPRVESRNDGLYWITPKVDKDSGELSLIPLAGIMGHISCLMAKLLVIQRHPFSLMVAALHLPVMPFLVRLRAGGIQWLIWPVATHQ
ncbi:zinc-binding domain of primase-helicase family protein [Enterobacter cloacae]|nr:zinc-binding domain of primase-helicase family protein [Enterobacter cloacae]